MRTLRVGWSAVLVEVDDVAAASALYAAARRHGAEAADIVPGARTVLFDGVRDVEALVSRVASWDVGPTATAEGRQVEVPTRYDGADLDGVARLWEMTSEEVVATHTSTEFVVAFCGFSPGFAYCTGLPAELSVPRLDSPRTKVPAGSVGLAGEFTGIYPTASPGGWQLIGRTELELWDATAEEPAALPPGTRLRFTDVGR